ncbi:hypothetical protein EV03_0080 [Prochlorococcus marinus str. PAC1]|uniref:Uncharacterized protein n=1 Tax=Prochlorococcus marinus str. PAC1 TaxID=59924 RepID=A0A0A2CBW7_PROMR|nr:hypothetical protein EV03_0080 [Prochlorococcus marinus str. PAC1]
MNSSPTPPLEVMHPVGNMNREIKKIDFYKNISSIKKPSK